MARFYVRFDTRSQADLDSDFFDYRSSVGANSASGAQYRSGLISSRSLLSADVYDDLDSVNQNGGLGTYFPPDSGPFSTDTSTFVSWSTAYTSSIQGIAAPATNRYAQASPINYSLRPTASVLSTNPGVGATTPRDPVKASYQTYISASNAVTTVLNAIVGGGPYSRLGTVPARTVHSIWHDPDLTYFAWDDFTPGTPQTLKGYYLESSNTGRTTTGSLSVTMSYQYLNDFNPNGSASISAVFRYASSSGQSYTGLGSTALTLTAVVPISSLTTVNSSTKFYLWDTTQVRIRTGSGIGPNQDEYSTGANLHVSISFYDPLINTSTGSVATLLVNTGASTALIDKIGGAGTSINSFIKIGSS
jgi:hypothetical protein